MDDQGIYIHTWSNRCSRGWPGSTSAFSDRVPYRRVSWDPKSAWVVSRVVTFLSAWVLGVSWRDYKGQRFMVSEAQCSVNERGCLSYDHNRLARSRDHGDYFDIPWQNGRRVSERRREKWTRISFYFSITLSSEFRKRGTCGVWILWL